MTPLDRGLDREEAARRLREGGPNELAAHPKTPPWRLMLRQFEDPLVLILVAAAVISGLMGDIPDAVAIAVIVSINAVIGFVQERKAERAMAALRSMTAPRAVVRRSGAMITVPAAEIVVGDLLILSPGDVVAADARVRESKALACNEAALTGESLPVSKRPEPSPADAPLAERHDQVFMGTAVAGGAGVAEVFATGMDTEIGRIAALLSSDKGDDSTPLQRRLDKVGRTLLVICAGLVAVVVILGWIRGMSWSELFLSAVSMIVAAVPEGMPAIITIALALGMQRMAARRVLVRRLAAVETLGSVTVICTDKTGTLTTGVMRVRELWGPDEGALLWAAAACCDAELAARGRGGDASEGEGEGDTTELAILLAARERGIERAEIEAGHPRLDDLPFSTERRRMSVLRGGGLPEQVQGEVGEVGEAVEVVEQGDSPEDWLWIKGAVEAIVERADPESAVEAAAMLAAAEDMASRGLRVLAVARGRDVSEEALELLGLIGLADPPREAAKKAIAEARGAGVRTMMITGDHPVTAHAIARELGLSADLVRARTTAEEKTKIVAELRAAGEIVAMTGDGVNDAPAIREADVGLAMGETATEVTREASDMVLVDDDLSSVVTAIREGRVIYDNIQKTVVYLLSGNFSELMIMLVAAAVGMPFPLLPLHLLWINLMTEPFPGLALVIDPPDEDVLRRPPRDPAEPLLNRQAWSVIIATALLQTVVGFGIYWWALEVEGRSLLDARSLAFSTVVCGELLRAFAFRSPRHLLWQVGALRNPWLVGVIVVSLAMQIGLYQLGVTRELFALGELAWTDLGLALAAGFIPVSVLESAKLAAALVRRLRR
ncbi:cation-translocating P-type ATPase [Pseudenhygromyxa sp. WMMC2535]|uniref:cation-translocating P-type ATPase n=1 Tax=Pseudenhygromyxa sp. WMMC2535 TaxID=2712867 RepID=UPI001553B524|nr:cation-translocating P-type ATPase [Pseudenhygromyxa sp. WMMC2535]NVB41135.1 cation-translocating P-type ATPase [Pseudenhygromyxa sp. WMMC2535]